MPILTLLQNSYLASSNTPGVQSVFNPTTTQWVFPAMAAGATAATVYLDGPLGQDATGSAPIYFSAELSGQSPADTTQKTGVVIGLLGDMTGVPRAVVRLTVQNGAGTVTDGPGTSTATPFAVTRSEWKFWVDGSLVAHIAQLTSGAVGPAGTYTEVGSAPAVGGFTTAMLSNAKFWCATSRVASTPALVFFLRPQGATLTKAWQALGVADAAAGVTNGGATGAPTTTATTIHFPAGATGGGSREIDFPNVDPAYGQVTLHFPSGLAAMGGSGTLAVYGQTGDGNFVKVGVSLTGAGQALLTAGSPQTPYGYQAVPATTQFVRVTNDLSLKRTLVETAAADGVFTTLITSTGIPAGMTAAAMVGGKMCMQVTMGDSGTAFDIGINGSDTASPPPRTLTSYTAALAVAVPSLGTTDKITITEHWSDGDVVLTDPQVQAAAGYTFTVTSNGTQQGTIDATGLLTLPTT